MSGAAPAEDLAGAVVEFEGDGLEVGAGVAGQAGVFGEVLAQQPVDASMSSGVVVPCDVVLPGGLVGGHGPVDDVDEVALQDPARAAGAFGWSVVCQQLLGCWAEALLHDGCGVKDAVEAAVSPAVEAVAPRSGPRMIARFLRRLEEK